MKFAIIAAGEGSRLVQEGIPVAKPLVSLGGQPMIGRLIDIFLRCDAEEISIIINEEMTQVREYLEGLHLPVPLHIVVKTTLSSMHSFYEVSRHWGDGQFVLTTVDTIFREEAFRAYVEAFSKSQADGCMGVTNYIDDEKPLYVSVTPTLRILGFHDTPARGAAAEHPYVSAGIYGLNGKALAILRSCVASGKSRMRNFQRALIEAGLFLQAFPLGKVIDVDHASDIPKALSLITHSGDC